MKNGLESLEGNTRAAFPYLNHHNCITPCITSHSYNLIILKYLNLN